MEQKTQRYSKRTLSDSQTSNENCVDADSNQSKRRNTCSSQLRDNLEQIVSEINAKRKRDSDLLEDLKKQIEMQMRTALGKIEDSMYACYNATNKDVEEKIQELMDVLAKIEKHETDLEEFKKILSVLNSDVFTPDNTGTITGGISNTHED